MSEAVDKKTPPAPGGGMWVSYRDAALAFSLVLAGGTPAAGLLANGMHECPPQAHIIPAPSIEQNWAMEIIAQTNGARYTMRCAEDGVCERMVDDGIMETLSASGAILADQP